MAKKTGQFVKGHKQNLKYLDKMIAAKMGNNNAKKLKTPELKKEAYRQYCEHLSKGKSKKSWCFEYEGIFLLWETMEKYIAEDPINFDPMKKRAAEIRGYNHWEDFTEECAKGQNKGVVPALQMIMRNKFGWDRETTITHHKAGVERLLEKWEAPQ